MKRTASAAAVALACVATGCGATRHRPPQQPVRTATTHPNRTVAGPSSKPRSEHRRKPAPSPGSLPQTDRLPSPATARFHTEMAALWSGVRAGSLAAAMPAFFPLGAYRQVKAIADPQADYEARLVGGYRLDLAAAHALLGPQPRTAQLITVQVPQGYAHWVSPGACYNRVGYYEVPNARIVYRQGGEVRSFGIASMISWRGVWYVVHLGAVLRPTAAGVVDDPSTGPGESIPSSTC